MINKKVCMIGVQAVGKTSLVRRYVQSIFTEKYLATIGVMVDKKIVLVDNELVNLILWDVEGDMAFARVRNSYIKGSSGYLIVIDGTRKETFQHALELHKASRERIGPVPFIVAVNKSDLSDEWAMDVKEIEDAFGEDSIVMRTSAKNGTGVEEIFLKLATMMLEVQK